MKEDILHYIWKFRLYNAHNLYCTKGNPLQIIYPGNHNFNQGPDFVQARIKLNDTVWIGSIEIHVQSSHWRLHKHTGDSHYNNVILHVVWKHDLEIEDVSANPLPVLELQSRVSGLLLERYRELMKHPVFIPCENNLVLCGELVLNHWKQRLVAERLIEKSSEIMDNLKEANGHWEEVFWWYLAANFGVKVNTSVFLKMAKSIPLPLLARHKYNRIQIEALLFGQAGLLTALFEDPYATMLQKEYIFLQKKYGLKQVMEKVRFLRMRPANFPSVRLAQLAQLIHVSQHLFSKIIEATSLIEVRSMFDISANDYWNYHYFFDKETRFKEKNLGKQMIDNIIINTVVPLLFSYGLERKEEKYKEKAILWLEGLAPEINSITKGFMDLQFLNKNAFDSQALLQLKNEYCYYKRCLQCSIGNNILKKSF